MARSRDDHSPLPSIAQLPCPPVLVVPSRVGAGVETPVPDWVAAGVAVAAGAPLWSQASPRHGAPVAPVDGRVAEPRVVRLAGGKEVFAVALVPDDTSASQPTLRRTTRPADASTSVTEISVAAVAARLAKVVPADFAHWLDRIQQAGIAADRWTSPDLIGQLRDGLTRPIDTLVCNLLDSDPWLPLSRTVSQARSDDVAAGLGLLGRVSGAADWWALVDQADPAADALCASAAALAPSLRIGPVENDYPQLDPALLIRSTTGRRLRPGRLPSTQGVLLVDAAAAAAVGRLLTDPGSVNGAMTSVPVTVYDQPTDAMYCVHVPVGTSVGWLLKVLEIPESVREVYAGGPLRQIRARGDDILGPAELTLFAAPPQPLVPPQPCVRCGWCVEACPTRCRPAGLLEASQRQDTELARQNGLDACIECGLCTFVCPSHLPLLEGIRHIRRQAATE